MRKPFSFYLPVILMTAAFIVMFVNNCARADTVTIHLASKHITASGKDYGLNEDNLGLGYGLTLTDNLRAIVGGYNNSIRNDTVYVGAELYTRFNNPIVTEVGIDGAAVTGYDFKYPVGVAVYTRLADVAKVHALPLFITHPTEGTYLDGVVIGFSLTFGE